VLRLQKEYKQLSQSNSVNNFVAVPDPINIFEWHFCIFGLKDCVYENGFYHGKILFPTEYPLKPPGLLMLTNSGRFQQNKKICLSISDFHPETWNPIWKTETIMTALVSFMNSDELTTGCITTSDGTKRALA
jgi:ubiquitin-conjugating enzyme E2 J2